MLTTSDAELCNKPSAPIATVLVVESSPTIARSLSNTIASSGVLSLSAVATTLDHGLRDLAQLKPRLVILDLDLPDGSGLELIAACAKANWAVDALVHTALGKRHHIVSALQAGAKGYLSKGSSFLSVEAGIGAVLAGEHPISPEIAGYLVEQMATAPCPQVQPLTAELTKREIEILKLISRGQKRQQIGKSLNITSGTVGNHITKIYRKLDVTTNIEAVKLALRMELL